MQTKLRFKQVLIVAKLSNIAVNDSGTQKGARYSRVLVVSGTKRNYSECDNRIFSKLHT